MGKSEHNALASRIIVLLTHLLKWQFQPERRQTGISWLKTIKEQRNAIHQLIRKHPSLKYKLQNEDWFLESWNEAVQKAVGETGLSKSTFPPYPIWATEEILNQDFFPLSAQEREEQNLANGRKSPCADDDFSIGY